MNTPATNKEITAQAIGGGVAAFLIGGAQWLFPQIPPPPVGFEAGAAVVVGFVVALVRRHMADKSS